MLTSATSDNTAPCAILTDGKALRSTDLRITRNGSYRLAISEKALSWIKVSGRLGGGRVRVHRLCVARGESRWRQERVIRREGWNGDGDLMAQVENPAQAEEVRVEVMGCVDPDFFLWAESVVAGVS